MCERRRPSLRRNLPVSPRERCERLDRRRVTLGIFPMVEACCALWSSHPAIRSRIRSLRMCTIPGTTFITFMQKEALPGLYPKGVPSNLLPGFMFPGRVSAQKGVTGFSPFSRSQKHTGRERQF